MTHTGSAINVDHVLGLVGLFLMLVVARLADPAALDHSTASGRYAGFAARRAIDVVGGLGWLFDRLPERQAGPLTPRPMATGPGTATDWVS